MTTEANNQRGKSTMSRFFDFVKALFTPGSKPQSPVIATSRIIILYAVIGIVWLYMSDRILLWMTDNLVSIVHMQVAKAFAYVIVTAFMFYLIVYHQIKLLFESIDSIHAVNTILDQKNADLQQMERHLYHLAYHSRETNLPNKLWFENTINELIQQRTSDQKLAIVILDIDHFNDINEMKGHIVGDTLLHLIGEMFDKKVQEPHVAAHLGADEFGLAFFQSGGHDAMMHVIHEVFDTLKHDYTIDDDTFEITFSAGIACHPGHGDTFLTLYRNAHSAMTTAKAKGKNQIIIFDEKSLLSRTEATNLTNQLRKAIKHSDLMLHYQPIINLKSGHMQFVEALIRWTHPDRGNIPPLDFIPLAEKTGLIKDMDYWVFNAAFKQYHRWHEQGMKKMRISINVSARTLVHPDFIPDLFKLMTKEQVQAKDFIIEITESIAIHDMKNCINVLKKLKKKGFLIALDDFGTGYSSLNYFRTLPIDQIKIDRSFINKVVDVEEDRNILEFIVLLAHRLKIEVVAEGVEDIKQDGIIRQYGVDFAQGYFYGRPVPASEIANQ
ncbi:MAG: bifunctional diguanylate cyclase/phosphodiesterase [Acholeplasmataceae bacterium]|nr:MAG: bifunctional diguanylate cyclase/phosphodiesterase [Acholeplasmataceae bacterium]